MFFSVSRESEIMKGIRFLQKLYKFTALLSFLLFCLSAFELSIESHFALNVPSAARLLVRCWGKFFLRIERYFL